MALAIEASGFGISIAALVGLSMIVSSFCVEHDAAASDETSPADAVIESINELDAVEKASLSSIKIHKLAGSDLLRSTRSLDDKPSMIDKDRIYWVVSFMIGGTANHNSYSVTKIVDCLSGELVSDP